MSRALLRPRAAAPTLALLLVIAAGASAPAAAGPPALLDYRTGSWFLPQTPGVTAGPVGGLFNPAAFALTDRAGADLWCDDRDHGYSFDRFGFAAGRLLNVAYNRAPVDWQGGKATLDDWQLGLAGGTRAGAVGLAYRWAGGVPADALRDRALVAGAVGRPARWLSLGASRAQSLEHATAQNLLDVGLRPFGTPTLTLFGDWTVDDGTRFDDGNWGAGLEVRPVRGLQLGVRARQRLDGGDPDVGFLVGFSGTTGQVATLPVIDSDGELLQTTLLTRSAPPLGGRDLAPLFGRHDTYLALDLQKRLLTYQKYRWLDDERLAWLDLYRTLEAFRADRELDILAVNLAGFRARPSLRWELRAELQKIRDAGKRVLIYTDRADLGTLALASVADELVVDPQGDLALPGLALTRSYLKGTLAKLGLGFQEHRYFRYKSAVETLSRDSLSEADREQRQRLVDVIYEALRDDIATGRRLAPAAVDSLVDTLGVLMPEEALAAGLVDRVGRWDQLLEGLRKDGARPGRWPETVRRAWWDEQWGPAARIPVVFLVGDCAMDSGINGRRASAWLRGLVHDRNVKAVVLRVDSPGGDPLPCDLVADAVRALKEAGKPVVVSQGDVAASGGYWLSMDGSRVLTTPVTITGSIGVISGWLWDDGLAAKAGITAESVQRGRHADLYSEIGVPFLGGIPRRPMNEAELARTETVIRGMYGQFVAQVARGRGLAPERVDEIAQGRVWMGGDAIARGLCDGIGGLGDAITAARALAGLPADREVELVEYPPRPLVELPRFGPRLGALAALDLPGAWLDGVARKARAVAAPGGGDAMATMATTDAATTADGGVAGGDAAPVVLRALRGAGLGEWEARWLLPFGLEPGWPRAAIHPDELPADWRRLD